MDINRAAVAATSQQLDLQPQHAPEQQGTTNIDDASADVTAPHESSFKSKKCFIPFNYEGNISASRRFALLDTQAHGFLERKDLSLNNLQSDILRQIASHLDISTKNVLALANKNLKCAVRDIQTSVQVLGSNLADALKSFPYAERVRVMGLLTQTELARIAGNNVQHLDLSNCRLTEATIRVLPQKFPNLSSLDLSSCDQLCDAAIMALVENCPKLTSLNLNGCYQLSDAAIRALAKKFPNLTSLSLLLFNLDICKVFNFWGL